MVPSTGTENTVTLPTGEDTAPTSDEDTSRKDDDAPKDDEEDESFSRDYVEKLRAETKKWRLAATEGKQAAKELDSLKMKDATVEERVQLAEKRAVEAEALAARREIALDQGLSKEDAVFLDGITDEGKMLALAARLAKSSTVAAPSKEARISTNGNRKAGSDTTSREQLGKSLFGS